MEQTAGVRSQQPAAAAAAAVAAAAAALRDIHAAFPADGCHFDAHLGMMKLFAAALPGGFTSTPRCMLLSKRKICETINSISFSLLLCLQIFSVQFLLLLCK